MAYADVLTTNKCLQMATLNKVSGQEKNRISAQAMLADGANQLKHTHL